MEILRLLKRYTIIKRREVIDYKRWNWGFYIKLKIVLSDESLLFITEYSDEKARHYSYHWQDKDGNLRVRWDNSPHHKNIKTHPHHKHIHNKIIESKEIILEDVLNCIESEINK